MESLPFSGLCDTQLEQWIYRGKKRLEESIHCDFQLAIQFLQMNLLVALLMGLDFIVKVSKGIKEMTRSDLNFERTFTIVWGMD